MLSILAVITPIYLLIGLGYAMTRWGLFKKEEMRVLGKFVLNVALPALIIRSLTQTALTQVFHPSYLAVYFLGTSLVIALGYLWSRGLAGQDKLESTFNVIGMSCANSGFIGYPLLLLVMPPMAGQILALNMLGENLLIIPFLIFMAERDRASHLGWSMVGQAFKRLLTNPVVLGIGGGLICAVSGVVLPSALAKTIDLMALASSALSLFVIGGSLVGISLRHQASHIAPTVLGKLIIHPLLVFAAAALIQSVGFPALEPDYKKAALIMAATPMMGVYPTLAQAYGREGSSALNMLVATVLSFPSLSLLLWILL